MKNEEPKPELMKCQSCGRILPASAFPKYSIPSAGDARRKPTRPAENRNGGKNELRHLLLRESQMSSSEELRTGHKPTCRLQVAGIHGRIQAGQGRTL